MLSVDVAGDDVADDDVAGEDVVCVYERFS